MSEPKVFLLPDLGEGLTEAELVNWLVAVGDEIRVDQPIAEVETAKSMVEVPSPYAGTVAVLHGEPGQTLDVGKPLISVMPIGAAVASSAVRRSGMCGHLRDEAVELPLSMRLRAQMTGLLGSRHPANRLGDRRSGGPLRSPAPPGNPMPARSPVTDQDIPRPSLLLLAVSLSSGSSRGVSNNTRRRR